MTWTNIQGGIVRKFIIAGVCIAFSTPSLADDPWYNQSFLDSISHESFRDNLNFPSETVAMKYFAAICVRNRNSAFRAIKALEKMDMLCMPRIMLQVRKVGKRLN